MFERRSERYDGRAKDARRKARFFHFSGKKLTQTSIIYYIYMYIYIIIAYLHENNKTPEQLHIKSREIWQSGWRPSSLDSDEVGSGADVEAGAG